MPAKLTQEEAIHRFRAVHGDTYDYSKVVYQNNRTKVTIICLKHGEFEQSPSDHMSGKGCKQCGIIQCTNLRQLTQKEAIQKFYDTHGDKYDYSKVVYKGVRKKVIIICSDHGGFEQAPVSHWQGRGCPQCGRIQTVNSRKLTQEEVLQKCCDAHGNKYDYSKMVYQGTEKKVTIICPIHGEFEQSVKNHIRGDGCPKCSNHNILYRSFNDAQQFAQSLGIKSSTQWNEYCKSGNKPADIPSALHNVYKGQGWKGYGDFLGNEIVATQKRQYRSFVDVKKFVRLLGLKGKEEWNEYCKSGDKPDDIPSTPYRVYKNEGWSGWADFLGYEPKYFTKIAIINFLKQLREYIHALDAATLMMLSRKSNIPTKLFNPNQNENNLVDLYDIISRDDPPAALDEVIADFENANVDAIVGEEEFEDIDDNYIDADSEDEDEDELDTEDISVGLEHFTPFNENLREQLIGKDALIKSDFCTDKIIDYILKNQVNDLWYQLFNNTKNHKQLSIFNQILDETKFTLVVDTFNKEREAVALIKAPAGFSGTNGYHAIEPNWMQKLASYRLKTQKRFGNWSGTGAGKTFSAIMAGRHCECRRTVIVVNNSNVEEWVSMIKIFWPDSNVTTKVSELSTLPSGGYNYVVLNYEKFSTVKIKKMLDKLAEWNPEYVVIDEIQNVKVRAQSDNQVAGRRKAIEAFMGKCSENNPDLHVMGMSATPCVTNLREVRSLLQLILNKKMNHIPVRITAANAISWHAELVRYGIRYIPDYGQSLHNEFPQIDGSDYLTQLYDIECNKGTVLEQEQILCEIKSDHILELINGINKKAGSKQSILVYTHFVDGIASMLEEKLKSAGHSVGLYTGDNSGGVRNRIKKQFVEKEIDILIGSSAIGTGVDGLQKVCNHMIIASLPWTHSEYKQLEGRIYRQGWKSKDVHVYIPQVFIPLNDKQIWSRDKERFSIIEHRRTLSDCVLDGCLITQNPEKDHQLADKTLSNMIKEIFDNQTMMLQDQPCDWVDVEDKMPAARSQSPFVGINRSWKQKSSDKLHKTLQKNPEQWHKYHDEFDKFKQDWGEIPVQKIAKMIPYDKDNSNWKVADLGCGRAELAKLIGPSYVDSYDHVACNDSVVACDIADLSTVGVKDETYYAVVLSLVCNIGTNWRDYIAEAKRILKPGGWIYIAESLKSLDGDVQNQKIQSLMHALNENGFAALKNKEHEFSHDIVYMKWIKV